MGSDFAALPTDIHISLSALVDILDIISLRQVNASFSLAALSANKVTSHK
jgi:hypothetical protein